MRPRHKLNALSVPVLAAVVAISSLAVLPDQAPAGLVIRVPLDQPTIAAGLGAAGSGDTVRVDCDTYFEAGLSLPDGVVLESAGWDSGCVVIDGTRRGTILSCSNNTSGTVRNMTFTDGSDTHGGAVYCSHATVTFEQCAFEGNTAETGGAIYWDSGNPDITGCTFVGNVATSSGGAIALFETGGSVVGSRFAFNQASVGGGAFAHLLGTTTVFRECEFHANTASSFAEGGGGIYNGQQVATSYLGCMIDENGAYQGAGAYNAVKSEPVFNNCLFDENDAQMYGGGVYGYDDSAEFDICEFTHNITAGTGGALYLNKSDVTMSFCAIYMNEAVAGGGILTTADSTLDMHRCTFVENSVDASRAVGGAGILLAGTTIATIDRTIIAFNRGGEGVKCDDTAAATITCSDVSDNDGGDWAGCIAGQETGNGNIHADPLICNVEAYWLDLCADSPCLDVNNDCGMTMGASSFTCAPCGSAVESSSWGAIKAIYR